MNWKRQIDPYIPATMLSRFLRVTDVPDVPDAVGHADLILMNPSIRQMMKEYLLIQV